MTEEHEHVDGANTHPDPVASLQLDAVVLPIYDLEAFNDADLQQHLTDSNDAAWRYRETDLWRELVQRTGALSVALRAGPGSPAIGITALDQPGSEGQAEPVTAP